jgi:hypothetical protein
MLDGTCFGQFPNRPNRYLFDRFFDSFWFFINHFSFLSDYFFHVLACLKSYLLLVSLAGQNGPVHP